MNKYREALEHQQEMLDRYDLHWSNDELAANRTAYYTLEELVDLRNPKQVLDISTDEILELIDGFRDIMHGRCPRCGRRVSQSENPYFCPHEDCAQALDWEGK